MKEIFCFSIMLLPLGLAAAEDPVVFADPVLKAEIEKVLEVNNPTPADMLQIERLFIEEKGMVNLSGIEHAKNLTFLSLFHNQISDIQALSGLTKLENLNLAYNQITSIEADIFTALTSLTSLMLYNNQITNTAPEAFAGLAALEWLDLSDNQVTSIGEGMFADLENLIDLRISGNQITDLGANAFAGLAKLEWLLLNDNQITSIAPDAFTDLPRMQLLGLSNNMITDSVAQAVSGLQISYLVLSNNQITDISIFSDLESLMGLHLSGNQITSIDTLPDWAWVHDLDLSDNQITDLRVFAPLRSIRNLYLAGNQITDARPLLDLFFERLDISRNPLERQAYCTTIPLIESINPFSDFIYDPMPAHYDCNAAAPFIRGDVNADNRHDLADAIFTLSFLFNYGATPICLDAVDANDDGSMNLSDAIAMLNHLFGHDGDLPEPYDACGVDPTADKLTCSSHTPCQEQ